MKNVFDKSALKEIRAEDVRDKIRMGQPVEYDHVIIKGDLNLSQLCLPDVYFDQLLRDSYGRTNNYARDKNSFPYYRVSTVDTIYLGGVSCSRIYRDKAKLVISPIKICNSTIEGNIDFSNTLFLKSINFENTQVGGNTTFDDERCSYMQSIFLGPVNFRSVQFNGTAAFGGSYFNETANFEGSVFNGSAQFSDSIFKNETLFSNSLFKNESYFSDSEFYEYSSFIRAQYMDDAYFKDCIFHGYADFFGTEFNEIVVFMGSNFTKKADFKEAIFNGSAYFISSIFNDDVHFWDTYHHKPSYFVENKFNKNVDFFGSQFIQGVDFKRSQFNGNTDFDRTVIKNFINLTEIKFNILDIFWPDNTLLVCDHGPTYLGLIKNFRDLERYETADKIYFEYRYWRQSQKTWFEGSKYWDIVAKFTCGYGVRMGYTISCSIIILFSFGILYLVVSRRKRINGSNLLAPFLFSAIILLSVPKELYPSEIYEEYAKEIKYIPIFERLIGWGLLLLLIQTFSRVMIRY